MANSIDKQRKKMNILVIDNDNINDNNKNIIKSKNIICPECGDNIRIEIKNFKIDSFECKNNHKINNMSINEFENTQIIDLKNIKCDICKERNKYDMHNNEFYKCYECNMNICPICKMQHNNTHKIYSYDKYKYICCKHNENLTNYCTKCKMNLCTICENNHLGHNQILLRSMMPNKNELLIKFNDFKKKIKVFNGNINRIITILKIVKENINNYCKLEEYLINNYEPNERNYEILYNIKEIINNNNIILNDINQINNDDNIQNKFNNILNIYNRKNNVITMTVKIGKNDINREIYFLDNSNASYNFHGNGEYEQHHHDFLKELNETNVELYINNKLHKYKKYFIPEKEGIYNILLKFNTILTDCTFMFSGCYNLINIDLSSFDTKNVSDMKFMFYNSYNLKNINLSSFNTQNVKNMKSMFSYCKNLRNIDLTSFDTKNVENMDCMFECCENVVNFDLSSFDMLNVRTMKYMFEFCYNLREIDLSYFIIKNVNTYNIFQYDHSLKEIKINPNSYRNLINAINQKVTKITYC